MNIQSNINQTLSLAGMLVNFNPTIQERVKEQRARKSTERRIGQLEQAESRYSEMIGRELREGEIESIPMSEALETEGLGGNLLAQRQISTELAGARKKLAELSPKQENLESAANYMAGEQSNAQQFSKPEEYTLKPATYQGSPTYSVSRNEQARAAARDAAAAEQDRLNRTPRNPANEENGGNA